MKALLFLLVFATTSFSAHALVDMRNGNFANTWVDLEVPGTGYDLKVVRTYNSKSLHDGIFGFGWCSDFESNLSFTAEGNIKFTECGAGQEIFYTPREFGRKDIDRTIQQIIAKVRAAKKVDEKTLGSLTEDMVNDHDLRAKFALSYKVQMPVKEGTTFFANGKEVESITFAKGIYTRNLPDGSSMRFDQSGRLTHMYDKNGNFLRFSYDKNRLNEVADNNGRKLNFRYYNNGKVQRVVGPNNLSVDYKFSNLDDLSSVKNSWGNQYTYDYDDAHNMTKATFPDKTAIQLTYDKKNDWVVAFTDREKCVENYKYEFSEKDPRMNYWSTVKKTCGKEVTNESRHEFWYAKRSDGQVFLQRVQSKVNNNVTDVTYHDSFGKPISIRRNNERYDYEYFANGQVKSKATSIGKMNYKYDPKSGKVSEVVTQTFDEKGKVATNRKTEFKYDGRGNLTWAQNSDGLEVTMTYDNRGRIATITDQAKKVVRIEYEERFGKPTQVTRPGLGTIRVTYKSNGEIDKVQSPEGPTVAMQVASTFNNLLDVIAPATAEVFN